MGDCNVNVFDQDSHVVTSDFFYAFVRKIPCFRKDEQ